jgi:hypothetical protein
MNHFYNINLKKTITRAATLLLALGGLLAVVRAQDPHFTSIDFPGAAFTVANAVNVSGDIVGFYRLPTATGGLQAPKGFIYSNGVFTTVQKSGAARTRVFGINDAGDIVGDYLLSGVNYGFILLAGSSTFQSIRYSDGTFQSPNTDSWGIDNEGNVTGGYTNSQGSTVAYVWRANSFTRTFENGLPNSGVSGATISYTHGIKPNGEIVGCYFVGTGPAAEMHGLHVMTDGSYVTEDFPGSMMSMNWRISPSSISVGHYIDMDGMSHGYLSKNGEYETIDYPEAAGTLAKGIAEIEIRNPKGNKLGSRELLIVGQYSDSSGNTHGYLFSRRLGVGTGESL